MTSTFPTCKANLHHMKHGLHEIQVKKEALTSLEFSLKKRITELRELCLKEAELTGDLPIDYPLQPREPIPQVRRRAQQLKQHSQQSQSQTQQPQIQNQTQANQVNIQHLNLHQSKQHSHQIQRQNYTNLLEASTLQSLQNINLNATESFQPYYEETKPFQMSDFYRYSSKYRQNNNGDSPAPHTKTTRQLQEDVLKKNSLMYSSCDDQIQHSVKLIERSGHKMIEATAKAIAVNPSLAEKLNGILPSNVS